jgi:hypothetical protein
MKEEEEKLTIENWERNENKDTMNIYERTYRYIFFLCIRTC